MPTSASRLAAALMMSTLAACGGSSKDDTRPPARCTAPAECSGTDTTCRARTCDGGVCGFSNAAPDTTCGAAGAEVCDGAGACVACNAPSQCPGSDGECRSRTCIAHACGFADQPYGTTLSSQVAGDCQSSVCDGSGGVLSLALDTDVPADDGNACTGEACVGGAPAHPPLAARAACVQGGTLCDGAGACVACLEASDCGADTACRSWACSTAAACVPADATDGTSCPGGACAAGSCVLTPPTVTGTTPSDGGSAAAPTGVAVTFSAAMQPGTLTAQTTPGACTGSIQVSSDDFATCAAFAAAAPVMSGGDTVATLAPAPSLLLGRTYRLRVTTAATSATGAPLAAAYTSASGFAIAAGGTCTASGAVLISQVYGGGGNTGATYRNDFVELHNPGTTTVNLGGWAIQYASSAGTSWATTVIPGGTVIAPGGFLLIQEAAGAGGTTDLPLPDVTDTLNLASSAGKVALTSNSSPLGGACPVGGAVVDFLAYGWVNCSEGSATGATPAPGLSNTTAALRGGAGCADTNVNAADFTAGAPAPRSGASPALSAPCACRTANESDLPAEADSCALVGPTSLLLQPGVASEAITGALYQEGVTDPAGEPAGVVAQLGHGPATANPEIDPGWTWQAAAYASQSGLDDRYSASFTAPAAGAYRFTFRFSVDGGATWTYCDANGAGANPGLAFELGQLGVLDVTP